MLHLVVVRHCCRIRYRRLLSQLRLLLLLLLDRLYFYQLDLLLSRHRQSSLFFLAHLLSLEGRFYYINFLQLDKNNGYDVDVKYVNCSQGKSCINALLNKDFKKIPSSSGATQYDTDGKGSTLAYYTVVYKYKFLVPVPFVPNSLVQHVLTREFVMVQEWQRSQFPVTP